jgi:hypothetical protein
VPLGVPVRSADAAEKQPAAFGRKSSGDILTQNKNNFLKINGVNFEK